MEAVYLGERATPVGVERLYLAEPRVARASQPWALVAESRWDSGRLSAAANIVACARRIIVAINSGAPSGRDRVLRGVRQLTQPAKF